MWKREVHAKIIQTRKFMWYLYYGSYEEEGRRGLEQKNQKKRIPRLSSM